MAPERSSNVMPNQQLRNSASVFSSSCPPGPSGQSGAPPPVPPRQTTQSYSGYNDYRSFGSNYYGGYGFGSQYRSYGGYGNYGGYSPYSNMGFNNYGPLGPSGDVESRFTQYAEESTRSTFQVIETVLQTFSSLTMLLESTYFAMTNSFKAILSVAENISRLKSTLGQLLSTFALIRFLKWMYKRMMHMIGIQKRSTDDELWEKSLVGTNGSENPSSLPSSWTGILLFSVFVVIPYIIHRISTNLKQMQTKDTNPREWHKTDEPVYTATVQYDFVAANKDELSVRAGQKLYLAPQSLQPKNLPGWCRATDNTNVGLVPYNYIAIVGQLKKKPKPDNTTSPPIYPASDANEILKAGTSITVDESNTGHPNDENSNSQMVSS